MCCCILNGLAQLPRRFYTHALHIEGTGKGNVIGSLQIGRDVAPAKTPRLIAFDSGIGGIVEDDHYHVKLLLYSRCQFAYVEQEAAIATERHDRTLGRTRF